LVGGRMGWGKRQAVDGWIYPSTDPGLTESQQHHHNNIRGSNNAKSSMGQTTWITGHPAPRHVITEPRRARCPLHKDLTVKDTR
jgi:hypothetical protein